MQYYRVALGLADEVVARVERTDRRSSRVAASKSGSTPAATSGDEIKVAMQRVRESRWQLARLPSQRARQLRQARGGAEYEALKRSSSTAPPAALDECVWPPLERARKLYDEAFGLNPTEHWAAVQYISLRVMRHGGRPTPGADAADREVGKLWTLAEVQSLRDLSSVNYKRHEWSLGNLIELYLLAPVIDEVKQAYQPPRPQPDWRALATQYAKELAKMARPGAFEIFSTRRPDRPLS